MSLIRSQRLQEPSRWKKNLGR